MSLDPSFALQKLVTYSSKQILFHEVFFP